jgi:hypothetical protein
MLLSEGISVLGEKPTPKKLNRTPARGKLDMAILDHYTVDNDPFYLHLTRISPFYRSKSR